MHLQRSRPRRSHRPRHCDHPEKKKGDAPTQVPDGPSESVGVNERVNPGGRARQRGCQPVSMWVATQGSADVNAVAQGSTAAEVQRTGSRRMVTRRWAIPPRPPRLPTNVRAKAFRLRLHLGTRGQRKHAALVSTGATVSHKTSPRTMGSGVEAPLCPARLKAATRPS